MCPRSLFDFERRVVVLAGYLGVAVLLLLMALTTTTVNCDSVVNEDLAKGAPTTTSVIEVMPSALNGEAIQLAIAWDGHRGGSGRRVDVNVRTKKVKLGCPSITCLKLGIDADQSLLSLPEHYHYMEEPRECDFYPGCTYSVILKYEDSAETLQQDVTIPDCVENMCRCDYQEDFPEFSVKLNYEEKAELLHFNWDMKAPEDKLEDSELKYFVVRYFKVHTRKTVINVDDTFEPHFVLLNESLTGDPWIGLADLQLSRAAFDGSEEDVVDRIKVEVFLSDSKECHSKSSIEYLQLTTEKSGVTDSHWIPTSLIIIIVGVITSLAVAVLYYSKSKLKRHLIAKLCRWPINYSNININNSMTRTSIALQENVIYVEKELYEAKITGVVDNYEVSPSCLSIGREIGKGAFGRVFVAAAKDGKGNTITVAVKRLKRRPTDEEAEDFFKEIQTMKRVGYHENIISLIGCCTMRQPVLMIMEYVGNGDLQHYLQALYDRFECAGNNNICQAKSGEETKTGTIETESDTESDCSEDSDASYILQNEKPLRPSVTEMSSQHGGSREHQTEQPGVLNHDELQEFAIQIANGMSHLEDLDITHRDLATRNILIDHQKRLKISDFGLSRDGVYVTTKSKRVPLRWLSIEAIRRSLYSSKSDVWAFGVVLWEIGTLGRFPYQGVDNSAVLPFLLDGGRLKKPDNCSDKLYQVMLSCWEENPLKRPSFFDLLRILQEPEQKIYIDLDELGDNDVFFEAPATKTATGLDGSDQTK